MKTRGYVQRDRARATAANTERILTVALELFAEQPFDRITLAQVAERAGVGVQTVIRRVGTKDGLVRAVNAWVHPQVDAARGDPVSADPAAVAAAIARQYERWGALIDRTLRQEDVSPALAEGAEGGRRAHRAWIDAAFEDVLGALPAAKQRRLRAQLVAVCGVELWHVLRRDEGLSVAAARGAVADLIAACLATHTTPEP
jgi:AcrR family transcriptional regulator